MMPVSGMSNVRPRRQTWSMMLIFWREAAYWEAVGDIAELLPRLDVIAALAFVVETVDVHDRCTHVIAPKQRKKLSGYLALRAN